MTPVVTYFRFASVIRPVCSTAAITATNSTPAAATAPRVRGGSGLGTCRPASPRLRRNTTYCASPAAIPMAAAPKP